MNMMMLTELINRLKSESPKFFVILRWIFGVLAAGAFLTKWVIAHELWIPDAKVLSAIQDACVNVIVAASSIWGFSYLPVKDAEAVKPTPKNEDQPK